MDHQIRTLVSALAAPFRILLLAAFLLLAKMGYLTPEDATQATNNVMDFLVVAVPAGYAIWAGWRAWRDKQPVEIVKAAAALPEVKEIITTNDIAAAVPNDLPVRVG